MSGEPLSWADTRRMRMTGRVIQETMRVASILSFTFREAVEDVEYQGEQSRDINQLRARSWSFVAAQCCTLLSLSEYSSALPACLRMNWLGKDVLLTERNRPTTQTRNSPRLALLRAGYLIPKGWKVLPLFRNIHHNPDHFPSPEKFDPSRFEVSIITSSLTSLLLFL